MSRHSISDTDWKRNADLLPGKTTDPGRTARDNRLFLDAVLWIGRTGSPWRDLPEDVGTWNSVYRRFSRRSKTGVWEWVFTELQDPDLEWMMIDTTVVRVHQHAAGQKRNPVAGALGRSRGGFSTKVSLRYMWPSMPSAIRFAFCSDRARRRTSAKREL